MANNNSGRDKNEKDLVCSFCGKHQDEVERMIIGPGVNICSECIGLCADLLSDKPDHQSGSRPSRGGASRARIQATDGLSVNIKTPAEIKEGLDQYVIGQDEAKRVLAVSVYNHCQAHPERQKARTWSCRSPTSCCWASVGKTLPPCGWPRCLRCSVCDRRCHHPDGGWLCG